MKLCGITRFFVFILTLMLGLGSCAMGEIISEQVEDVPAMLEEFFLGEDEAEVIEVPTNVLESSNVYSKAYEAPENDFFDSIGGNASRTYPKGYIAMLEWDGDIPVSSWSTSDKKVVQVGYYDDMSAYIRMVKTGKAKITIKLQNGQQCTLSITVVDVSAPTKITLFGPGYVFLHKKTVSYVVGSQIQLFDLTLFDNEYLLDDLDLDFNYDYHLTWKSSKSSVASVDANGLVTCKKKGTAKISVTTSNGLTEYCTFKVTEPPQPKSVSLNYKGTVELPFNRTLQLVSTVAPSGVNTTYTWSSSSTKIATVSASGLVRPVAKGTTTITVKTANGKKASVKVKVYDPNAPQSISLNEKSITMKVGGTRLLRYTIYPSTATQTVTIKSSDPKVVFVDYGGVLAAIKKGSAKITVTTSNGIKATLKVKVTK